MIALAHVRSLVDTIASVTVIAVGGMLMWSSLSSRASSETENPVQPTSDLSLPTSSLTKRLGSAKLMIVEFADFECPYCARHATETLPILKREFVDKGTLSYAFVHFPLQQIHPRAFLASEGAECAARQGNYWQMHERLFRAASTKEAWNISEYAKEIGLATDKFESCMRGEAKQQVDSDIRQGRLLGVESTPSFFLGFVDEINTLRITQRLSGALPIETLRRAIVAQLQTTEKPRRWFPWPTRP